MTRPLRLLGWAVLSLAILAAALAFSLWLLMRASLPRLDGDAPLTGLSASASVTRDALGTAAIHANAMTDAMRALGYVHAQERFFEMDLARRSAAGELAALFGKAAVDGDRDKRLHRFRAPDSAMANPAAIAAPTAERLHARRQCRSGGAGLASVAVPGARHTSPALDRGGQPAGHR